MEDIILLETKIAKPDKKVFKLQFTVGEFDMVVFDQKTLTCQIYEVKYSKEQVPEQYRHIINEEKCAMTSHRYGEITGRYVIYRGDSAKVEGVQYLNVEEYLKALQRTYQNKYASEVGIKRYDVGVDANGYYPVSLNQIENFFKSIMQEEGTL